MSAISCEPYTHDGLAKVIAVATQAATTSDDVKQRGHYGYLCEYLDSFEARTIIVEPDYVDRDYLDDYAAFYARCYADYGRRCVRLHFSTLSLQQEEITDLVTGADNDAAVEAFRAGYLGFSVIKPLAQRFVGRTCLRTYPAEDERVYPVWADYEASLHGLPLNVRSLPFQEQDGVTAACASAALWSAFHATSRLFGHELLSPSAISRVATDQASEHRLFPAGGLTLPEMIRACRHVGLDPDVQNCAGDLRESVSKTVVGYAQAGIPAVLGVSLFYTSCNTVQFLGLHAVAVAGYRVSSNHGPHSPSAVLKLYAHDDGVGPFARMEWKSVPRALEQ